MHGLSMQHCMYRYYTETRGDIFMPRGEAQGQKYINPSFCVIPDIHTMVPCDTLTPRALRVSAHATCLWVLVRFELAMFGSQAERSNHYTSVAAYILQCSFIPCVLVVLSPLWVFFFSRKTPRLRLVFFLVYCHSLLKSFSLNVCR